MKIAIVTDSSSGLLNEEVNKDGIYVLPIPYTIEGVPYTDNQTFPEFIKEISDGKKFAKTSQVAIGVVEELYENLLKEYDYIIHLPIAKGLSSTFSTAVSVASRFEGKIRVVDQAKVAGELKWDVLYTKKLIDQGVGIDDIVKALKERYNSDLAFITPFNLTTLKHGGRISAATAAIGNLIGIKPIIQFKDGKLDSYGKERATIKVYKTMLKGLLNVYDKEKHDFIVYHCNEEYRANEIAEFVRREVEDAVIHFEYIPVSIVAHTGPGTIGLGIVAKI